MSASDSKGSKDSKDSKDIKTERHKDTKAENKNRFINFHIHFFTYNSLNF